MGIMKIFALIIVRYNQVTVQPCIHITSKELFHCPKIMLYMVFIKRIVIRNPVCKLNVNWRVSGLHQLQIHKQPPSSAISVNKRMNPLEFNMKPCKPGNDMLCTISISLQQLFHLRLDQIWLNRFMFCAHNPDGNSSVNTPIFSFILLLLITCRSIFHNLQFLYHSANIIPLSYFFHHHCAQKL